MTIITCNEDNDNEEWWAGIGSDKAAKVGLGNYLKAQDPSWRSKVKESINEKYKEPEYREKQAAATKKLSHDPEWQEKVKVGIERRTQDPEWRAKNAAKNREQFKDKQWLAKRGAVVSAVKSKPIHTPFGEFKSLTEAATELKLNRSTIFNRMKKSPNEYYYLPKPTE